MQEFKFEGCSDDTFGEYGVTNDDYDNCASGEPIRFQLTMPDGAGIIVTNGKRNKKKVLEATGKLDEAKKHDFRQFRYIYFLDKQARKKCLLQQEPYPKHYVNP